MASTTHQLNQAEMRRLLSSPQGGVARDLVRRGLKVETRAKMLLSGGGATNPKRVDTGRLRSSISTQLYTRDGILTVGIGTNVDYALMVHDGTGLYGPRHAYIVPVNKSVLRWKTRGGGRARGRGRGGYTFAKRSSGMKPNPFLKDALPAARG
jgi:phage gpG-like protein